MDKRSSLLTHYHGRMNTAQEIPILTPDAGETTTDTDPNSPANIAKRARYMETQSGADTKYDAKPPARVEPFENWVTIQWDGEEKKAKEITIALFLATSVLLFLYAAAPNRV